MDNGLWIDQERESFNNIMQKWLRDNDILIYPIHNEGKSVVARRFTKILKSKIYSTNDS